MHKYDWFVSILSKSQQVEWWGQLYVSQIHEVSGNHGTGEEKPSALGKKHLPSSAVLLVVGRVNRYEIGAYPELGLKRAWLELERELVTAKERTAGILAWISWWQQVRGSVGTLSTLSEENPPEDAHQVKGEADGLVSALNGPALADSGTVATVVAKNSAQQEMEIACI